MKLYEKINEEEILCRDITLPQHFPAIYIDEYDRVYCYLGVLDKHRVLLHSSPYYLKNKKSSEIKESTRGFFRIENGAIVVDREFMDEKNSLHKDAKCKLIPAHIHFPQPQDMSFGIYSNKYSELEDELTRKIFELTYNELNELLYHFNNIFEISNTNIYNKYPSITRSIKSDNYCEINDLWIPAEYPYIAFEESNYFYSHISLYSFYKNIKFITKYNIESIVSKKMITNGLKKEILENLFNNKDDIDYNSILITRTYYYKLLDECEKK